MKQHIYKNRLNNYVEFDNKRYTVYAHNLAPEYVKTKESAIDFETIQLDETYINYEEEFNSLIKDINDIIELIVLTQKVWIRMN